MYTKMTEFKIDFPMLHGQHFVYEGFESIFLFFYSHQIRLFSGNEEILILLYI